MTSDDDSRSIAPGAPQGIARFKRARRRLRRKPRLGEHLRGKGGRTTDDTYASAWADAALFFRGLWGDSGATASWADPGRRLKPGDRDALIAWLHIQAGRLTTGDVEKYRDAMDAKPIVARDGTAKIGLEGSTINMRLAALAWLCAECGRGEDNPVDAVARVGRARKFRQHAMSREEAQLVLQAIDTSTAVGTRDAFLLRHLMRTGRRREDAALTLVQDIVEHPDLPGRWLLRITPKGGREHELLLTVKHHQELVSYIDKMGLGDVKLAALFPVIHKSGAIRAQRPLSPGDVSRIVRERTKKALGRARSPHALRATFATLAERAGASIGAIQKYLGHKNRRTTELYFGDDVSPEQSAAEFIDLDLEQD